MSIENLIRVVPPPERPGDPFAGPWREVESKLGTVLPADYKAFVRRFGLGYFMEYLRVWTPRAFDSDWRLEQAAPRAIEVLGEEHDFPFPLWPQPAGLLPFGSTLDGDFLAWVTSGSPDDWHVAVLDRGMGFNEAHVFRCDLTDFLAGLATGQIDPPSFQTGMLECEHLFVPDPRGPEPLVEVSWRVGHFGAEGRSACRLGRR